MSTKVQIDDKNDVYIELPNGRVIQLQLWAADETGDLQIEIYLEDASIVCLFEDDDLTPVKATASGVLAKQLNIDMATTQ